jgi:hypothetical protein
MAKAGDIVYPHIPFIMLFPISTVATLEYPVVLADMAENYRVVLWIALMDCHYRILDWASLRGFTKAYHLN